MSGGSSRVWETRDIIRFNVSIGKYGSTPYPKKQTPGNQIVSASLPENSERTKGFVMYLVYILNTIL